jgi:transcriptional regulator with XRE-family HTH domain
MTQKQLAVKARVGAPMISMIESGDRTGSPAILKRVAAALGVALDDLVT